MTLNISIHMRKVAISLFAFLLLMPLHRVPAEEGETPIPDARTLLKRASAIAAGEEKRNHTLMEIAEAQSQLGELHTALQTIMLMQEKYTYKWDAIAIIVDSLIEDGKFAEAVQVVSGFEEETPNNSQKILEKIAVAKAKAEDFQGALKVISNLDRWSADRFYRDIALFQAEKGDVDKAFQLVSKIQDRDLLEITTVYIGGYQAKAGDIEGALKTGGTLRPEVRAHSRWPIVCQLAEEGNIDAAFEYVPPETESGSERWARDLALRCLPPAQAKQGQLKNALETASSIVGLSYKQEALLGIVRAKTMQGDFSGAEEAIAFMDDDDEKDRGFFEIVQEYSQRGQFKEAMQTALNMSHSNFRDVTLEMVIGDQAQAGLFRSALEGIAMVQDSCYKARALSAIATALARAGQQSSAWEIINERITGECYERMPSYNLRTSKMPNGKRQITSALGLPDPKLITIRELATRQTEEGDIISVLEWANDLAFPLERASALLGAARGLLAEAHP